MSKPTTLVRTKLTADEWRRFKVQAARLGVPVSELAADALRAVLKGAKP